MDQGPLVVNQIDDGFHLAQHLVAAGIDVTAMFWVWPKKEDSAWALYVASKVYDEKGYVEVGSGILDALKKLDDPWITMFDIKAIGANDPITKDVLEIMRRHPGPMAVRSRKSPLGKLAICEVFVYPPVEGVPRRQPIIKIVGVRKEVTGPTTREVEDEIGYVEGVVGEAEFNTKFTELVKTRFGSMVQFQETYPRIVLQVAQS